MSPFDVFMGLALAFIAGVVAGALAIITAHVFVYCRNLLKKG